MSLKQYRLNFTGGRRRPIKGLDLGLEPYIERINQNPDITTTGSHDGFFDGLVRLRRP